MKMPCTYKPVAGSRYGKFAETDMEDAMRAVKDGMSKAEAARTYGVDRTTLNFRLKRGDDQLKVKKPGGQPGFAEEEEQQLSAYVVTMSKWGFPISALDLQFFAKAYLDKKGVKPVSV